MFGADVPAHLVEAAEANIAYALNPVPHNPPPKPPKLPTYPEPLEMITDAVRSGNLSMFLNTDAANYVFPIPAALVDDLLRSTGFSRPTRETIVYRFKDHYPRSVLNGLDFPSVRGKKLERFALCLREGAFDGWMAQASRQQSWPLGAKPRRRPGRPDRVSVVTPLVKTFVTSGRWQAGMPLKLLVGLVNSKLRGEEVDRETVKKTLKRLYAETGKLEYRYVPRRRKARRSP
jgi:hypothetical protein